jgi:nitroimidazol reductase NimA-like FMN-containing flavoprotein (pyridoxamine 5'-phosphate oxidase superfamily)
MHETSTDLADLDRLLDASHRGAGPHLREIFHDDRRLTAAALAELLPGVQILSLATVTADCRPIAGAVDGLFFRGHFYFGSSPDSVRFRHLRARPQVSATHLRGEELAVVVHGTAHEIDPRAEEHSGFRSYVETTYQDWSEWGSDSPYARIDPTKMFAAWLPGAELAS